MAIAFARAQLIQRSKGHSSLQRWAYLTREKLVSERTGQSFDFRGREGLLDAFTLLPAGVPLPEGGATAIWNKNEASSSRKDAALGIELVLGLPALNDLPLERSIQLARAFVRATVVDSHNLAASVAIHAPQARRGSDDPRDEAQGWIADDPFGEATAMAATNLHAHVLISPRQITAKGFERRRYTALDPIRRGKQVYGRAWGQLWHLFQNDFFARIGSDLRVTPNGPISLERVPLSAIRRWRQKLQHRHPDLGGRALLVHPQRERASRQIVETVEGALDAMPGPFTRLEMERFYQRHTDRELARELTAATLGSEECVRLPRQGTEFPYYASVRHIHEELAAFGRGLRLGRGQSKAADVSPLLREGFAASTREMLARVFAGPDLIMLSITRASAWILNDIAAIGQLNGLLPISVATAAGHAPPTAVLRSIQDLGQVKTSNALMLVDDIDALSVGELDLLLAAAFAGNNKLILVRRQDTDWPRLELLDLLVEHVNSIAWRNGQWSFEVFRTAIAPDTTVPSPHLGAKAVGGFQRRVEVQERSALAIRTAITTGRSERSSAWPAFAVDMDGNVTTDMAESIGTVALLSQVHSRLRWTLKDSPSSDHAAFLAYLQERLEFEDVWRSGMDDPFDPMQEEMTWDSDAEESALAALDRIEAMHDDAFEQDLDDNFTSADDWNGDADDETSELSNDGGLDHSDEP